MLEIFSHETLIDFVFQLNTNEGVYLVFIDKNHQRHVVTNKDGIVKNLIHITQVASYCMQHNLI